MKIKKTLIIITFIIAQLALICIAAMAQTSFVTRFNYAPLNGFEDESRPIECADGGFIIMGSARWLDTFPTAYVNMIAAKLDSAGHLVWSKSYGNSSSTRLYAVAESPTGFLFCGNMWTLGGTGYSTVLIKTDQNGDTLWTRKYENMGSINNIKYMPNGDFICTGQQYLPGSNQPYVMRIDSVGTVLWRKDYAHQPNIGVGGRKGYVCNDGSIIFYFQSMIMVKLDTLGDYVWSLPYYNFPNAFWANDITEMGDGSYLLAGKMTIAGRGEDGVVSKISPQGTIQWIKNVGSASTNDIIYSASTLPDGSVILNGAMENMGSVTNPSNWVLQMDTTGNVLWSKRYYGITGSYIFGEMRISSCPSGGFISSGAISNVNNANVSMLVVRSTFDTLCYMHDAPVNGGTLTYPTQTAIAFSLTTAPYTEFDSTIYVTDNVLAQNYFCSTTTGITNISSNNPGVQVYPNPFYDRIWITAGNTKKINEIEIWDTVGKLRVQLNNYAGDEIQLNTLSSGIYFMRITIDGEHIIKKLVKE